MQRGCKPPPLVAQPPQRQRDDTQKRQLAPSIPVYLLLHDEADNGAIIDFEYERGESSSSFTVVLDFIKSENLKLCVAAGVQQPEPMKCSFIIPPGGLMRVAHLQVIDSKRCNYDLHYKAFLSRHAAAAAASSGSDASQVYQ